MDIAVASARRIVPGLYIARGVTNGTLVHLSIRRTSSVLGFANLSAGDLVQEDDGTGPFELPFPTSSGFRYLVVAYPIVSGGAPDANHASSVEVVP